MLWTYRLVVDLQTCCGLYGLVIYFADLLLVTDLLQGNCCNGLLAFTVVRCSIMIVFVYNKLMAGVC